MIRIITRLYHNIKSKGIHSTFYAVRARLFPKNFLVFFLNYENANRNKSILDAESTISFRKVELEELKKYRDSHPNLPPEFYCDDSHGFSMPFFAEINNEVAAIQWLTSHREYSRDLVMQSNEMEFNYLIVFPKFRGQKIGQKLTLWMALYGFREMGATRFFIVPAVTNIAQWKPMIPLGFTPLVVITQTPFSHRKLNTKKVVK